MGDVLGNEQETDRLTGIIAARCDDQSRTYAPAILAHSANDSFPLAIFEGGFHDLARLTAGHILRSMQHLGVHLAHNFFRLVAVHAAGTLVPQQNLPVKVLADDGIFCGRLEDIADEFDRLLRGGEDGTIEESRLHGWFLCSKNEGCKRRLTSQKHRHNRLRPIRSRGIWHPLAYL